MILADILTLSNSSCFSLTGNNTMIKDKCYDNAFSVLTNTINIVSEYNKNGNGKREAKKCLTKKSTEIIINKRFSKLNISRNII